MPSTRFLALASSGLLLTLIVLCVAWEMWLAPLRPGGSWMVLKAALLLLPLFGILHERRYTAPGGVLVIDSLMVADELASGALVKVLPDYILRAGQPIYLVYPARTWLAHKTATLIAFLQERLFI